MDTNKTTLANHHDSDFLHLATETFSAMRAFSGSWDQGSDNENRREAIEVLARSLSNTLRYAEEVGIALTYGRALQQFSPKGEAHWLDLPDQNSALATIVLANPELYDVRTIYIPVDPKGVTPEPEVTTQGGCSKCGCVGIHACLGYPIPPWTKEKIAELNEVLSQYETESGEGENPELLHDVDNRRVAAAVEERQALWSLVRRASPMQDVRRLMREKNLKNQDLLDRLILARPDYTLESLTELLRGSSNIEIDDLFVLADALDVPLTIDYGKADSNPI
jgi:hypothetical protein